MFGRLHGISCISAALGAGPGVVPAPETREVPPKTAQVQALGLKDAEPSFRLEIVNGVGLPGPKLGACWRQVGGDGLTQAVVRLEHPAQRLTLCGCCSDMFYGPVSSYSWSCPAPPLPE